MAKGDYMDLIKNNKGLVVMVSVVVLFLFATRGIYMREVKKAETLKGTVQSEKEKSEVLERIVSVHESLKKFKTRGWETTDANIIIEKLYNIGLESQMKLRNISPGKKIEEKNYTFVPFAMSGEGTYIDFLRFLKRIETNPSLLMIMSVGITPFPTKSHNGEDEMRVSMSLSVQALYLK